MALFRKTLRADIADPVANEAKIIAEIEEWGPSDLGDVVQSVPPLQGDEITTELLRTPAGQRIVRKARDVMARSNDPSVKVFVAHLDAELGKRAAPGRSHTPEQDAELAKVRSAVATETPARKQLYASVSPPLDLDVKFYEPSAEIAGGVFYDPFMTSGGTEGAEGTGGETHEPKHPEAKHFGTFIRIGPLALRSDDTIRSVLLHEFQHYRIGRERAKGPSRTDPAATVLEAMRPEDQTANEDVEVLGLQIADDVATATLKPEDHAQNLWYLAKNLDTRAVKAEFRNRAFGRIVTAAATNASGLHSLIAAFKALPSLQLSAQQIKLLDPLLAQLRTLTAPKPKPPAKKGP
jgi:hypothetical protein